MKKTVDPAGKPVKPFRKRAVRLAQATAAGAALLTLAMALTAPSARATEDDRAIAEKLAADLDHDTAHKLLTSDAVAKTRSALERATRMRQAGDDGRARETEALARSWAELGRDLVRTADTEARAGLLQAAANDAGAHVERERALLEEAIARNGRLQAEMDNAQKEENAAPTRTAPVAKTDEKKTATKTKTSGAASADPSQGPGPSPSPSQRPRPSPSPIQRPGPRPTPTPTPTPSASSGGAK